MTDKPDGKQVRDLSVISMWALAGFAILVILAFLFWLFFD
jgi:hypothetical protein